jgi:hypothetical protein
MLKIKVTHKHAYSGTTIARNPEIKLSWCSAPRLGRFSPGKPGTHSTGGCVDLNVSLDGAEKSQPTGIRSLDRAARIDSVYRLGRRAATVAYVPPFTNSTFCPYNIFVCSVWISEQTAIISLYSIR